MRELPERNLQPGARGVEAEYMPQLDAVRAFAVLGVLISHNWIPQKLPWILAGLNWGDLGVRLFFVLSGYLITRILLDCRSLCEARAERGRFLVRQFYARRFLRIFPIYYLTVGVTLAANVQPAREMWLWLISYTSNLYVALHAHWVGRIGHFWSLAVEEQFYFVWPWLVLFFPRRWVVGIVATGICVAPLYRLFALVSFTDDFTSGEFARDALTLSPLDSLGAGALLTLIGGGLIRGRAASWWSQRMLLSVAGVGYVASLVLAYYVPQTFAHVILGNLAISGIFYCVVSAASRRIGGTIGHVLELKPLVYVGKISYGIYIYHAFTPALLALAFARLGLAYEQSGLLNFVLSTALTLAVAIVSWRLVEQPINSLKRHFRYASVPRDLARERTGTGSVVGV
jgi:peptidoglycan/LPS O-acetylase OafA/YrhL